MIEFKSIRYKRNEKKYYVKSFSYPRFSEIDSYGVMWNGHYVSYFEEARLELCRHFSIQLKEVFNHGFYLPVCRYEVKMKKPVLHTDQISIAVRFDNTDQQIRFEHLLLVNNEIRAEGEVTHMFVDSKTLNPQFEVPSSLQSHFSKLDEVFA